MVKVSIIVPVHNAGEHLRKCVDTLLNQSLKEIEVILVLDCPTDGTDLLAEEYAAQDKRVVILKNKKNLHIGLSRNRGIEAAKGEFIGFSDHDDYRLPEMYQELYNKAVEEDADIVASGFGADRNGKQTEILYPTFSQKNVKDILLPLLIGVDDTPENLRFFAQNGGMWNKIYRRKMLIDNDIRFVDNRKCTYEDLLFLIQTMLVTPKVALVNKTFYYHVEDIGNASSVYFYNSYPLVAQYLKELFNLLTKTNTLEKFRRNFDNSVVNSVFVSVNNEYLLGNSKSRVLHAIQAFRKLPFVKQSFRNVEVNKYNGEKRNVTNRIFRKTVAALFRN